MKCALNTMNTHIKMAKRSFGRRMVFHRCISKWGTSRNKMEVKMNIKPRFGIDWYTSEMTSQSWDTIWVTEQHQKSLLCTFLHTLLSILLNMPIPSKYKSIFSNSICWDIPLHSELKQTIVRCLWVSAVLVWSNSLANISAFICKKISLYVQLT